MLKKVLLTGLLVFLTILVYCQDNTASTEKLKINKSALYGGLGITPVYGHITVNYEYMFAQRPDKAFKYRGVRVGSGMYQYFADASLNTIISYMCLTGTENKHFELGLGVSYMHFTTLERRYIAPAPNAGYRYQKPDGKFIFRTGIGFPELLYVSFGYAIN